MRIAEKFGVEQNFLFLTTFKRYQVQLTILNELEQKIKEDGTLVTKEYVKGRGNVYTHPAINEYNKTAVPYKKIGLLKIREEEFPKNTLRKILRRKMDMTID